MKRLFLWVAALLALAGVAHADIIPFPPSFKTQEIATNGTTIHVRVGGTGPAVVLLHGYGETGDMWVADGRRPGPRPHRDRARPARHGPVDQAGRRLRQEDRGRRRGRGAGRPEDRASADVVAHDIGNMVAFAFAAQIPTRVTRLVLIDAPLPGIGPWEEILKNPLLWHFRFGGPDMERLVAGRERIYLDRFWNEFSADPANFPEGDRVHYAALYARPGAMHAGFEQFARLRPGRHRQPRVPGRYGKLTMPVLALGGGKSFGPMMATVARAVADNVTEGIVPASGHWIMEENPKATIALVRPFLDKPL